MADKREPNLVIAISHASLYPWKEIRIAQQETWIASNATNAQIIFYLAKPSPLFLKKYDSFVEKFRFSNSYGRFIFRLNVLTGNLISHRIPNYIFREETQELIVSSWSTYQLFGRRNLALFDWFINFTDGDFLFQTNVSSYLRVEYLQDIVKKFSENELVYAGAIINPDDLKFPIVSGAGKLLSRKLIMEILNNKNLLKFDNLEDVALAELISKLGVKAINLLRLDLPNLPTIKKYSDLELREYFHFRCKSDSNPRKDVQIMKELHRRLSGKSDK